MFLILSKTLTLFLEPLVIPYLFFAVGIIARWRRRRWIMRISFIFAITLPLIYGILPLSSLPLQFLEGHVTRGEIGQKNIDGIIVLGAYERMDDGSTEVHFKTVRDNRYGIYLVNAKKYRQA